MEEYKRSGQEGKNVFVGVDLHRFKWHVTVRTSTRWGSMRCIRDNTQNCE
jgi:hypothetical protein